MNNPVLLAESTTPLWKRTDATCCLEMKYAKNTTNGCHMTFVIISLKDNPEIDFNDVL